MAKSAINCCTVLIVRPYIMIQYVILSIHTRQKGDMSSINELYQYMDIDIHISSCTHNVKLLLMRSPCVVVSVGGVGDVDDVGDVGGDRVCGVCRVYVSFSIVCFCVCLVQGKHLCCIIGTES